MDIGATICRPRNPDCARCPLFRACLAARNRIAGKLSARRGEKPRPARVGAAFYAERARTARFSPAGVRRAGCSARRWSCLAGLGRKGTLDAVSAVGAPFAAAWRRLPGFVEHAFTHFTLRLRTFRRSAIRRRAPEGLRVDRRGRVADAGFSGLMRKAAEPAALAWADLGARVRTRSDATFREKTVISTILMSSHSDQLST